MSALPTSHVYPLEMILAIRELKGMRRYPKSEAFMNTSECVKKKKKTRGGKKVREKMLKKQQKQAEAAARAAATAEVKLEILVPSFVEKKLGKHGSSGGGSSSPEHQEKAKMKKRSSSSTSDNILGWMKLPPEEDKTKAKRGSLITNSLSAAAEAAAASVAQLALVDPVAPDPKRNRSLHPLPKKLSPMSRRHASAPPKKLGKHYSHDLEMKQEAEMSKVLVSTLNKLTESKFEKLAGVYADQIIKSVPEFVKIMTPQHEELSGPQLAELNAKCAQRVIRVAVSHIFDKALKESSFCRLYASLCKHLHENAELTVMSNGVEGVRKCVISQCQREFEVALENAKKLHNIGVGDGTEISSQYPQAAKLRMVGNIRFVAELFLVNQVGVNVILHVIGVILTRSIESRKTLGLYFEEELETLCVLIKSAGRVVDTANNQARLNHFFEALQKIAIDQVLCSRIRFAIQDVIDLRSQHWEIRKKPSTPKSVFEKELSLKLGFKKSAGKKTKKGLAPRTSSTPKGTSTGSSAANLTFVSALDKSASIALAKAKTSVGQMPGAAAPRTTTAESSGRFSFGSVSVPSESKRKPVTFPSPAVPMLVKAGTSDGGISRMSLNIEAPNTPRDVENDDSKSTVSGTSVESSGPEEVLKMHVDRIVEELFSSHEMKEALQCIDEIPADSFDQNFAIRNIAIVGSILLACMEKSDKERQLTTEFLSNFCGRKEVDHVEVEKAIEGVILVLEDLMIDCPKAPRYLSSILDGLNGCLSPEAQQVFRLGLAQL
eukprot:TRINITY_DN28900_c0_g1_i1.p1 TRINITY_DN28900_c0_g1~~TRINITY_DN28900_c0_g1_i1.p1  ORF type:complete len:775 (-),score=236.06 TRINITY_DN28900_c0_g1_i1:70-2394(-)